MSGEHGVAIAMGGDLHLNLIDRIVSVDWDGPMGGNKNHFL